MTIQKQDYFKTVAQFTYTVYDAIYFRKTKHNIMKLQIAFETGKYNHENMVIGNFLKASQALSILLLTVHKTHLVPCDCPGSFC